MIIGDSCRIRQSEVLSNVSLLACLQNMGLSCSSLSSHGLDADYCLLSEQYRVRCVLHITESVSQLLSIPIEIWFHFFCVNPQVDVAMLAKRIRSLEEGRGPGVKEHSTTSARLPKRQPFQPAASGPSRTTGAASTAGRSLSSGKPPVATKEAAGGPPAAQSAAAPGDSSSALAADRAIKLVNRMLSGGKVRRAHACLGDDPPLLLDAPPPINAETMRACMPTIRPTCQISSRSAMC